MADTKLGTFLATNKLNSKRILAVSHKLETLTREDRKIKHTRAAGKKEGGTKVETPKPRSGRPVTNRAIEGALAGKVISGPTKQRILRAVNFLLEQKKKDKVELKTLF